MSISISTKKWITGGALAAALLTGGTGAAFAATTPGDQDAPADTAVTEFQDAVQSPVDEPEYDGPVFDATLDPAQ